MNDRIEHIRNTYTKYGDKIGKETAVGHIRELLAYIDTLEWARTADVKHLTDQLNTTDPS